jgi:hypothetical protein
MYRPGRFRCRKTQEHVAVDAGHNAGFRFEKGVRVSPEYPGLGQYSISSFMNEREEVHFLLNFWEFTDVCVNYVCSIYFAHFKSVDKQQERPRAAKHSGSL